MEGIDSKAISIVFMSDKLSYNQLSELVQKIKNDLENKEAEVDQMKRSFLANVSHEIRTPMNAIVGFSNLLTDNNYNNDQKKFFIDEINKNSKELLRLIDNILLTASVESENLKLNMEFFSLEKMMDSLYMEFYDLLKEQNRNNLKLLLKKDKSNKNIQLFSDPEKLKQAIQNLLDNALKFTVEGSVEFGYRMIDDRIEFFITDTGKGIDDTKFKHIFNKFHRVEEGSVNSEKGLGIGLSIADKLIKLLGGKLTFKSTLGKGSSFQFKIPLLVEKPV